MEELEGVKTTPAGRIANERFVEAVTEPERPYPEGATFIGIDEEHFGAVIARAMVDLQPLVIVYPDGRQLIAEPNGDSLSISELSGPTEDSAGVPESELTDDQITRGLAHPIRVAILEILTERATSPSEIAETLSQPLNIVAYHFKQLDKLGLIESVGTEQRRGVQVHFFKVPTHNAAALMSRRQTAWFKAKGRKDA